MAKILFMDIETKPKLAYVWRFFKENISPKQVKEHGLIMSYSAIWGDSPDEEVMYEENRTEHDVEIVSSLLKLLDEADIVVGHNVKGFDTATVNARAIVYGLEPPSPYKVVDTYQVVKKSFKFESNSLEYLSQVLPIQHQKLQHAKYPGFDLWLGCMRGEEEAWEEMKKYNINDTLAVRDVYNILRPWVPNHPNVGVMEEDSQERCPACGSTNLERRGYAYTNVGKYPRYKCRDCGKWSRGRFSEREKLFSRNLLTNA